MRFCRPSDSNLFKHIKQTRDDVVGATCAVDCTERAIDRVTGDIGMPLSSNGRRPGLRPGAERRGSPRRAARVIIAGTERLSASDMA